MLIYKITNLINGKVYIGQTTKTLEGRIATHRNAFVSGTSTHLYNAMRKYGWDNFIFEVVDTSPVTKEELDELEKYYITKYDSIRNGYNMTAGGESNPMDCPCSRVKHDTAMRSQDVRAKISDSVKAFYSAQGGPSLEHRKHLSDSKKAFYASPESAATKEKFLASYHVSDAHRAALIVGRSKGVYAVDVSGQVVCQFDKVKDAAKWWIENGYAVKSYDQLCDQIKQSYVQDKYIKGLKWFYTNAQAGYRA